MSVATLLKPTTHDIVQHRHSLQLRSSSEDTALNIFSMYSTNRASMDSQRPLSYIIENPQGGENNDSPVAPTSAGGNSQPQVQDSPNSREPAPGEDADSFHVRSTYAQLEVHGVPGDGFLDGIELTRTRSNAIRTKLDILSRTSPEDELRFLSMVDRYGFYQPPNSQTDRIAFLPAASFAKRLSPVPSPSKGGTTSKEGGKSKTKVSPSRSPIPRSFSPAPPNLTVPNNSRARSRSASPISSHSRSHSLSSSQLPATPSSANPPPPRHETSRLSKWHRMLVPLPEPVGSTHSFPQPYHSSSNTSRSHSHSPSTSTDPHSHGQAAGHIPPSSSQASGQLSTPIYGGGNVLYWSINPRKEHKFRERVFKGVPDAWRAAAWGIMFEKFAGIERQRFEILKQDYFDTLDKPSPFDIQIDLDVPRTISGHITFRTRYGSGQRALFRVLHAFSLRCDACGYVQGMGPIAATLLLYFEPEKAYAIMVILHERYGLHDLVQPGFPGLLEAIYVMERVVSEKMPGVYEVFKKNMISSTSYTTKWFITLFANTVPFQTQLRLWDVFFLEGKDALVMASVGILWVFRGKEVVWVLINGGADRSFPLDTLQSPNSSFETILSLLSSFFVPEDEDKLLSWMESALGDWKLREQMNQWRTEWKEKGLSGGLEVL